MAARQTLKNRINRILSETTKGLHRDEYWLPVNAALKAVRELGWADLTVTNTRYGHDENGNPSEKVWLLEIALPSGKPFFGIITAHGAGTVADPLSAYDISAYIS